MSIVPWLSQGVAPSCGSPNTGACSCASESIARRACSTVQPAIWSPWLAGSRSSSTIVKEPSGTIAAKWQSASGPPIRGASSR